MDSLSIADVAEEVSGESRGRDVLKKNEGN